MRSILVLKREALSRDIISSYMKVMHTFANNSSTCTRHSSISSMRKGRSKEPPSGLNLRRDQSDSRTRKSQMVYAATSNIWTFPPEILYPNQLSKSQNRNQKPAVYHPQILWKLNWHQLRTPPQRKWMPYQCSK